MTEKEYLDKRHNINEQYKKDIDDLELNYCLSKTQYNVGDIVQDHIGAVRLVGIHNNAYHALYDRDFTKISLVFKGVDVKKSDFTPKKNGGERDVYETNIEKVLKKKDEV